MQTAVSTDRKTQLELGEYQGVDCIRAKDGLLYAAAWNGAALKKAHQRPCAHRWRARCRHPERGGRADRLCL